MNLKVLGCHGGESRKHRTTSFLLNDRVAIDAGAITGGLSLREQQAIEAVLVSHSHMDHVRDLATLADNRCQQGGPPLEVVGTPATLNALRTHFFNNVLWPDFTKIQTPKGPTVVLREVQPEKVVQVAGMNVRPVLVHHTIETAGFLVEQGEQGIAYSGDTGPTSRLWELCNEMPHLQAVLLEVSFPNEQHRLAELSGHHTPQSVKQELPKLKRSDVPVMLYHIKPTFQQRVEQELAQIGDAHLTVLRLEDQFEL